MAAISITTPDTTSYSTLEEFKSLFPDVQNIKGVLITYNVSDGEWGIEAYDYSGESYFYTKPFTVSFPDSIPKEKVQEYVDCFAKKLYNEPNPDTTDDNNQEPKNP